MSTTNTEPIAATTETETQAPFWTITGPHIEMELGREAIEFLNRLLRETGDSPHDLFKKMFGLYGLAVDALREGKWVGAVTDPEVLETEFLLD